MNVLKFNYFKWNRSQTWHFVNKLDATRKMERKKQTTKNNLTIN